MERPLERVRKWAILIVRNVQKTLLREIVLGGSRAHQSKSVNADTDLFIGVADGTTFAAAEELYAGITRTSSHYLTSTLSFRPDFGLRLRIAESPISCCSYFFYDQHMVRNVGHWRRGVRLWTNAKLGAIYPANASQKFDHVARKEEFVDGLLEIPSVLKYLSRQDFPAASIRLDRVILHIVNVGTLDPMAYLSGSDKGLSERLAIFTAETPWQPHLAYGLDRATLQYVLRTQITFILTFLRTISHSLYCDSHTHPVNDRYLADTIRYLQSWEVSLAHQLEDHASDPSPPTEN